MGAFADTVRDSLALANLREARDTLRDLEAQEWSSGDTRDLVARLTTVVSSVIGRLTVADRNLVSEITLGELEEYTTAILNTAQGLQQSAPDAGMDLQSVHDQVDELLRVASELPTIPIRTTPIVLERAAEQFDRDVSSASNAISEQVNRLRSEIAEYHERVLQVATEHTDLVAQLGDSAEEKIAEVRGITESSIARIGQATERLEREVTSIQEVFRESQDERHEQFIGSQDQRNGTFRARLDPVISEVEGLKDQARGMLEEVAGASTAEHYAEQRNIQKIAADRWRKIGVGALGGLIAAAIWIFEDAGSATQDLSVVWLVARSGLVISIIFAATYTLRQSAQHRRREEQISRVANELMLLWPFMNRLPDDDRKSLMVEITPLYFKGGISDQDAVGQVGVGERALDSMRAMRRSSSDA